MKDLQKQSQENTVRYGGKISYMYLYNFKNDFKLRKFPSNLPFHVLFPVNISFLHSLSYKFKKTFEST